MVGPGGVARRGPRGAPGPRRRGVHGGRRRGRRVLLPVVTERRHGRRTHQRRRRRPAPGRDRGVARPDRARASCCWRSQRPIASRLGRRISEPLLDVAGVAHRLREGDLSARAEVRGTEETEELARALNGLAERTTELLAEERLAVADLSHRLRTPVTALRLDAEAVPDPSLASRLQDHIGVLQRTHRRDRARGPPAGAHRPPRPYRRRRHRPRASRPLAGARRGPGPTDATCRSPTVRCWSRSPRRTWPTSSTSCVDNVFAHTAEPAGFRGPARAARQRGPARAWRTRAAVRSPRRRPDRAPPGSGSTSHGVRRSPAAAG